MNGYDLEIGAVLEDELYTTPPLMKVIVAKLLGTKQDIPKAFRLTKDLVSSTDLKHLRRIRDIEEGGIECIICKIDSDQAITETIKTLQEKFETENLFDAYRVQLVPSKAPRTEHQWRACSEYWPSKYAKSNYLIQCIEGKVFGQSDILVLKLIIENIIKHVTSSNVYTSVSVIFRYAEIYGIGLSSENLINQHPAKHSSMLAIDNVSFKAGAGHWSQVERNREAQSLAKRIQDELDNQKEDMIDYRMSDKFLPYLCTNYDVIVTEEPCMMCTMGLVQSRIRRLYYLDQESFKAVTNLKQTCYPDRAIESFLVHRDKSLNHRFEAWRIKLKSKTD